MRKHVVNSLVTSSFLISSCIPVADFREEMESETESKTRNYTSLPVANSLKSKVKVTSIIKAVGEKIPYGNLMGTLGKQIFGMLFPDLMNAGEEEINQKLNELSEQIGKIQTQLAQIESKMTNQSVILQQVLESVSLANTAEIAQHYTSLKTSNQKITARLNALNTASKFGDKNLVIQANNDLKKVLLNYLSVEVLPEFPDPNVFMDSETTHSINQLTALLTDTSPLGGGFFKEVVKFNITQFLNESSEARQQLKNWKTLDKQSVLALIENYSSTEKKYYENLNAAYQLIANEMLLYFSYTQMAIYAYMDQALKTQKINEEFLNQALESFEEGDVGVDGFSTKLSNVSLGFLTGLKTLKNLNNEPAYELTSGIGEFYFEQPWIKAYMATNALVFKDQSEAVWFETNKEKLTNIQKNRLSSQISQWENILGSVEPTYNQYQIEFDLNKEILPKLPGVYEVGFVNYIVENLLLTLPDSNLKCSLFLKKEGDTSGKQWCPEVTYINNFTSKRVVLNWKNLEPGRYSYAMDQDVNARPVSNLFSSNNYAFIESELLSPKFNQRVKWDADIRVGRDEYFVEPETDYSNHYSTYLEEFYNSGKINRTDKVAFIPVYAPGEYADDNFKMPVVEVTKPTSAHFPLPGFTVQGFFPSYFTTRSVDGIYYSWQFTDVTKQIALYNGISSLNSSRENAEQKRLSLIGELAGNIRNYDNIFPALPRFSFNPEALKLGIQNQQALTELDFSFYVRQSVLLELYKNTVEAAGYSNYALTTNPISGKSGAIEIPEWNKENPTLLNISL